jgi:prevent-host-death family protein
MKTMGSSEFKAKCLAVIDEVARTGEPVTILKRGRPVAQLVPSVPREEGYPQEGLIGTVKILGDVIAPALPPETWDAERGQV